MLRRRLSTIDHFYNQSHGMVQLAVRLSHPKHVPVIVEKLQKAVIGLQVCTTATDFVYKPQNVPVCTIPNGLSMEQSCRYMFENYTPDFSQRVANIGASDDAVVLSCGHICADGAFLVQVLDSLTNPNADLSHESLPMSIEQLLGDNLTRNKIHVPHFYVDETVTRVMPRREVKENFKNAEHIIMECPIETLQCYSNGKVHGLTDSIWACLIASAWAFNGRIDRAGVATCIDLRQFQKPLKSPLSVCLHYSNIDVSAEVFPNMTLKDLGRRMRDDMLDKIRRGFHIGFLQGITKDPGGEPLPGIGLEMSNIGQLHVKPPIVDAFIKSSVADACGDPLISFSNFSVVTNHTNTFHANVRYRQTLIDRREVAQVSQGALFAMQKLQPTLTITDAVKIIRAYQDTV